MERIKYVSGSNTKKGSSISKLLLCVYLQKA